MRSPRTYRIRQAILKTAKNGPLCVTDILDHPDCMMLAATRGEAATEFNELTGYGYLEPVPQTNAEYRRITAAGRAQINGEADRDIRVFGKNALLLGLCVVLAATLQCGCRTNAVEVREYYESGQIKTEKIDKSHGFIPWSEGDGKVIDLLDVNVNGASLGK